MLRMRSKQCICASLCVGPAPWYYYWLLGQLASKIRCLADADSCVWKIEAASARLKPFFYLCDDGLYECEVVYKHSKRNQVVKSELNVTDLLVMCAMSSWRKQELATLI